MLKEANIIIRNCELKAAAIQGLKTKTLVSVRDKAGNTLLHLAAPSGSLAVVEFFIKNGADPDATNNAGKRPLDMVDKGSKVGEFLSQYESNEAKLDLYLSYGSLTLAQNLIKQGNTTATEELMNRHLLLAAKKGGLKTIKFLLTERDINDQNQFCEVLYAATKHSNWGVAMFLMEKLLNPNCAVSAASIIKLNAADFFRKRSYGYTIPCRKARTPKNGRISA